MPRSRLPERCASDAGAKLRQPISGSPYVLTWSPVASVSRSWHSSAPLQTQGRSASRPTSRYCPRPEVLSFSFGPSIPWNKEVHQEATVVHNFMMLDFKYTLVIDQALPPAGGQCDLTRGQTPLNSTGWRSGKMRRCTSADGRIAATTCKNIGLRSICVVACMQPWQNNALDRIQWHAMKLDPRPTQINIPT